MSFLGLDVFTIAARIMVILLILPIHEYAHAFVARKCGDYTAENSGRLTFNPLAHVDPVGAILLLLTGYGWAKPVPINPNAMRNPRNGIIWTSLAGPFSNLIVAFIGMIVLRVLYCIPIPVENVTLYNTLNSVALIFHYFVSVNIGLAVFNLIPIPPLDGSKVLIQFLPTRAVIWIQRNQMIISIVFLVMVCSRVLSTPISFIASCIYKIFYYPLGFDLTDWVELIMEAIIG